MTVTLIPILVTVVGLLMYVLLSQPKAVEIGRIMFWVGLLATLLGSAGHAAISIH